MAMADSRIEAPTAANPRNLPLQSRLAIGPTSNRTGYKSFTAGDFAFHRDQLFHPYHLAPRRPPSRMPRSIPSCAP